MKSKFEVMNINTMLKHLKMAMSYCNIYSEVADLVYDPETESVICKYWSGYHEDRMKGKTFELVINVACDSNSAIISDVVKRMDSFFR